MKRGVKFISQLSCEHTKRKTTSRYTSAHARTITNSLSPKHKTKPLSNAPSNVDLLNNMITSIKTKGFNYNKTLFTERTNKVSQLTQSISTLSNKLHIIKQPKTHRNTCCSTVNKPSLTFNHNHEVSQLQKQLKSFPHEIDSYINNTHTLTSQINHLSTETVSCHHKIKQLNSDITVLKKQKEKLTNDLHVYRKQISILKSKISNLTHKTQMFMQQVTSLLNNETLYTH